MHLNRCLLTVDDTDLIQWAKAEEPIIQYPPGGMALEGFRDPYVIQQGGLEQPWRIILGSGIKGRGGTLLVYESQHLTHGVHELCLSLLGAFILYLLKTHRDCLVTILQSRHWRARTWPSIEHSLTIFCHVHHVKSPSAWVMSLKVHLLTSDG